MTLRQFSFITEVRLFEDLKTWRAKKIKDLVEPSYDWSSLHYE
jgi:hypothetical protein